MNDFNWSCVSRFFSWSLETVGVLVHWVVGVVRRIAFNAPLKGKSRCTVTFTKVDDDFVVEEGKPRKGEKGV